MNQAKKQNKKATFKNIVALIVAKKNIIISRFKGCKPTKQQSNINTIYIIVENI